MGVWNDNLKFDIEKLRSTKETCEKLKNTLVNQKTSLISNLEVLRNEWNTPAGKKFFEDQNTDWVAQTGNYINITNAVEELLDTAILQYEKVADEARRLSL